MFAFVACSAIFLLAYVLHHVTFRRRNAAFATLPTKDKYFIMHNSMSLFDVTMTNFIDKVEEWQSKLGEVFLVSLHPFHCGVVHVNDPVVAEAVSLHQPDRSRAFVYKILSQWIGRGFFLSSLERSKKLQKPLWLAFNPKNYHKVRDICENTQITPDSRSNPFSLQYVDVANRHGNKWIEKYKASGNTVELPNAFTVAQEVALDVGFGSFFRFDQFRSTS